MTIADALAEQGARLLAKTTTSEPVKGCTAPRSRPSPRSAGVAERGGSTTSSLATYRRIRAEQ